MIKSILLLLMCVPSARGSQQEPSKAARSKDLANRIIKLYPYVESNPKMVRLLAHTIEQNPARLSGLTKAVRHEERTYKGMDGGPIRHVNYLAQCMLETVTTVQEKAAQERLKTLFFGFLAGSCAMLLLAHRLRMIAH